ncbi:MAG TPA: hypothetical protein VGQ60_01785 [Nitrospiraceae bacterium]|nr:hypothetical protein [Nitrospiraceae bacterium]
MTRRDRALHHFRSSILGIFKTAAPASLNSLASLIADQVEEASEASDLWQLVRPRCEHELRKVRSGTGTLAHVVEWELIKLQARIKPEPQAGWSPLFRDKHVHIGSLIHLWRDVACATEDRLAEQGIVTFFDVGPWGGFNFVVRPDGYTRMPFSRLTLGIGSLASTPLEEKGGPFFDAFMPLYKARLAAEGLVVPEEWQYRNPKWSKAGWLLEISHTYYFPHHTYDRRTFVKVRLSREFETYEEIMVWDFLDLLARLYQTTDWAAYRQDTKDVDIRFDLQDFVSLNHIMEGVYQRTEKEERLLQELKESFRGTIRERPVLYEFLDRVIKAKWIENLYWAIAGAVLGVRKFERPVNYGREILTSPLPPQLLIPVKRHVQPYHERVGALRPENS